MVPPTFLEPGTGFMEESFSMHGVGGWRQRSGGDLSKQGWGGAVELCSPVPSRYGSLAQGLGTTDV